MWRKSPARSLMILKTRHSTMWECLTPDELAGRINDESFAHTEDYVRFINVSPDLFCTRIGNRISTVSYRIPPLPLNIKKGKQGYETKVILYVSLFQIQPESPSSDRFRMATFELPDHAYLSISKGSSSLLPFLPDTPLRFPRYLSSKPFTFSRLLSLSVRKASISVSLSL